MKVVSRVSSSSVPVTTAKGLRHDYTLQGTTGYSVNIKDLVKLYKDGVIQGYGKNRSIKDIKRIVSSFNPYCVTGINITDNGDDTYTISDGHHRMEALVVLEETFPKAVINVLVGPKGITFESYTKTNNNRPLSLLDKVSNTDGEIGSFLDKILTKAQFGSTTIYSSAILPTLADFVMLVANSDGRSKFDFTDVCVKRNAVNAITKGVIPMAALTPAQESRLVKALKLYKLLMNNIEGQKNLNKDWRKLIKSPGLFTFIMVDVLNNGKITETCPIKITEKWLKNSAQVLEQSSHISRRNSKALSLADVYKTILNCKPY